MKRIFLLIALLMMACVGTALAQNTSEAKKAEGPTVAVTASAVANTVRIAAPAQVLQIRLEVYASTGEVVFDSGVKQGSIIDWKITDAARALSDGNYLFVVTVRDFEAKYRQKFGGISLQSGQLSLQTQRASEVPAVQSQAISNRRQTRTIEAADGDESVTILREGKERAVVVAAHDGQNGQVTSTTGALTLQTGDFFSNQAKEQMRITPEGNVGIGTTTPGAKLDVAGTIRASGGIQFADGSVLTSAKDGTSVSSVTTVANGSVTPNVSGNGTTNKLTKWMDTSGGLADSTISEVGGNVGIGTTTPGDTIDIVAPPNASGRTGLHVRTTNNKGNSTLYFDNDRANFSSYGGLLTGGSQNPSVFFGVVRADRTFLIADGPTSQGLGVGTLTGTPVIFGTANTERMRISDNGNVGINTLNPQSKLETVGDIRISGVGNGLYFPDGTKLTTAGGPGGTLTGTQIVTAINDAATAGVVNDNRVSPNLARLNGTNGWTGANAFMNGLSANGAPITNVGIPVNAGDAVNKAYTDSNFVKFVPGAEQLSVGSPGTELEFAL